jgi:hypothetical protein
VVARALVTARRTDVLVARRVAGCVPAAVCGSAVARRPGVARVAAAEASSLSPVERAAVAAAAAAAAAPTTTVGAAARPVTTAVVGAVRCPVLQTPHVLDEVGAIVHRRVVATAAAEAALAPTAARAVVAVADAVVRRGLPVIVAVAAAVAAVRLPPPFERGGEELGEQLLQLDPLGARLVGEVACSPADTFAVI